MDIPVYPQMTVKLAKAITGGLSDTSKMPGASYSLPVSACKQGEKYSKIPGSVCSTCYAKRGAMAFSTTIQAHERRLTSLDHPQWVEAMCFLIEKAGSKWFRWFDAGDLQGSEHLAKIIQIARLLPHIQFWMPTQEARVLLDHKRALPKNLVVRVSSPMVDGKIYPQFQNTSVVSQDRHYDEAYYCPASGKDRKQKTCDTCRACWDKQVRTIAYRKH